MTRDNVYFEPLQKIAALMKASFALYDGTNDEMFNVTGANVKKTSVPEVFKPHLNDKEKLSVRFSGTDTHIVVHFLRFDIDEVSYVLILKDTSSHEKLLQFFNTAINIFTQLATKLDEIKQEHENEIQELNRIAVILRDSRRKHVALVDGIHIPIYSVDASYKVLYSNKAFAKFVDAEKVTDVINKHCYKLVFGFEQPCEWCLYNQVTEKRTHITSEISVMRSQKAIIFDLTMFPVMKEDGSGEFSDEHGAFLIDKTETATMLKSINKFRETVKAFKITSLSSMNEVSEIKAAYEELRKQYEMLEERYVRTMDTLELYAASDSGKRIGELQMTLDELEVRFRRAKDTSTALRSEYDRLQHKYTAVNDRVVAQVEQLLKELTNSAPSFIASPEFKKFKDEFAEIKTQMKPNLTPEK